MSSVAYAWMRTSTLMTDASTPTTNGSSLDSKFVFNKTDSEVADDVDNGNSNNSLSGDSAAGGRLLDEIQLVKLIVLVVVIGILLLTTCTFVLRTFSIFDGKKDDQ